VSERDFQYTPIEKSGSVFFGADDNIMLNYGYSNTYESSYNGRGEYNIEAANLINDENPYYSTSYMQQITAGRSVFVVSSNGYMWYRPNSWSHRPQHLLYRGCSDGGVCSPFAGLCRTSDNKARDIVLHFDRDVNGNPVTSGGFASVAANFIDVFTKFEYFGGSGSGLHSVPEMHSLRRENVVGYGLFMKSQFNGVMPEKRRATCEGCNDRSNFPIGGETGGSQNTAEWPYIGFHDDARIHTHSQKSLIEAPVIEFFGHAELDSHTAAGRGGSLTLKCDSLIFHDSAVFAGSATTLQTYTSGTQRTNDMRYGVVNDRGESTRFYRQYGVAIEMPDHNTPVLEFGYQRCTEPTNAGHAAPNLRSTDGLESTPTVGGDVIVSFKRNFTLPILNTVVANHARISFIGDLFDSTYGGDVIDACVRTELLRIRNCVEFYTDPNAPENRRGSLKMTSREQMPSTNATGIFPRHLHLEPGSELSLPGENSLEVIIETTVGGYGDLHENVLVKANGILAPGRASLMEGDCLNPYKQGKLTLHNLTMEKGAVLRISVGSDNCMINESGEMVNCTQTDTLVVQDSIFMFDRIPVEVLSETEFLDEGCYLFLEYGDTQEGGLSPEYVKHLELVRSQYNDYFFGFDFSTPGKVFLCVTTFPAPIVQRYIDLPLVDGVTTNPGNGLYYVRNGEDFSFMAAFSGEPLKVTATGAYSFQTIDLDANAEILGNNRYLYRISHVIEPWTVSIGPAPSTVANDGVALYRQRVWAHKKTLYVDVDTDDLVSIYNMTGVLYHKTTVPPGLKTFTLDRGVYIVTLQDSSVHKVIIQ
jgi:hypothetical protein